MRHANTSSNGKIAVVLDTGALLAKYYRFLPMSTVDAYTTLSATDEVKDYENKTSLREAIDLGLLKLATPDQHYIEIALQSAIKMGCIHKLSKTDLDIVALALQLQGLYSNVVVITDDYELQNLLVYLRVSFKPLRTTGIHELRVFVAQCPICGYVPSKPGEEMCPFCGVKILRKRTT